MFRKWLSDRLFDLVLWLDPIDDDGGLYVEIEFCTCGCHTDEPIDVSWKAMYGDKA
jgi:hypothetical protein